jgi:hypothetical protein
MHTPRMHKRFLIGQGLVGFEILSDEAAVSLEALA